jgi:hypothetical protein
MPLSKWPSWQVDQLTIGCLLYDFSSVCEIKSKLIYDLMQNLKQMWKVRNSKGLWYNLYKCILKDKYIMKTNFHLVCVGSWILIECVGVCNFVFAILRYVATTFNYVYKLLCVCSICNCKVMSNNSFWFITFIIQLFIYDGFASGISFGCDIAKRCKCWWYVGCAY